MSTTSFEEPNLQALVDRIAKEQGFQNPTYCISNASKPGQNFIGRLFRVVINETKDDGIGVRDKTLSIIFKASSTNLHRHEKMGGGKLFCTESQMYQIVFPTLNKFLKEHGLADSPVFPGTPRCITVELNHGPDKNIADVLVLEDKKNEGFEIVDFKKGLNGEQCRLALKRIALMHATSMALHQFEPETFEYLQKTLNKSYEHEEFHEVFSEIYCGFLQGLEMLGEPYKPGHPVYDSIFKKYDDFCSLIRARLDTSDLICITHMDFSSNNVMFKMNDNGTTDDACLIDFQTAAASSPVNDIASLLLCCTKKEIRDEHFDNLLKFYFDEVTRLLLAFKCDPDKIFSWDLYQRHLKRFMKYGVVVSLMALPIVLADESEFKVDMHSKDYCDHIVFTGLAKVKDPEMIKQLKQRLRDAVADAVSYGYL